MADRFGGVQGALTVMTDPRAFALSPRRVTVSTVGVPARITQLGREFPRISFALSLHAPTQV